MSSYQSLAFLDVRLQCKRCCQLLINHSLQRMTCPIRLYPLIVLPLPSAHQSFSPLHLYLSSGLSKAASPLPSVALAASPLRLDYSLIWYKAAVRCADASSFGCTPLCHSSQLTFSFTCITSKTYNIYATKQEDLDIYASYD